MAAVRPVRDNAVVRRPQNQQRRGSVLSGGGSIPLPQATPSDWVAMVNEFQNGSLSSRLGIPMIYGIDAVHEHNNVYNATIFPHNIGLGAELLISVLDSISELHEPFCLIRCFTLHVAFWDPELLRRIGDATAIEARATGIPYVFAPCIAVCRDPRWGRCYESYSEDQKVVQEMTDIILGLQGEIPNGSRKGVPFVDGKKKVAACAKHFVGDGGTTKGIDENNTVTDMHTLLSIHMPAYSDSIIKGVSTIMVSYSSWNGKKMHANRGLITGFLKGTLKFKGIDRITSPAHSNYTYSVEAGMHFSWHRHGSLTWRHQIDPMQVMVPYKYTEFIDDLTSLVKSNVVPMDRINDAVERILLVKFTMGLFEDPYTDLSLVHEVGSQAHRNLAREAVRKSLVLLKNGKTAEDRLLPLPKKVPKILVAGSHADNLGFQCGGWTINWQGFSGNNATSGTTILGAIYSTVDKDTEIVYRETPDADFIKSNDFNYAIVVVVKCVVVIISGRPLVVEPYVSSIDALVAAWLPGTEGQGVTDVLFGDYGFTGKLSKTWFRTVDQLPMNVGDLHYDPLFPFGFGLTTNSSVAR
nr:Glycoside hydrolase [Ipomoea batatas]